MRRIRRIRGISKSVRGRVEEGTKSRGRREGVEKRKRSKAHAWRE
jgi:hypothetical protein